MSYKSLPASASLNTSSNGNNTTGALSLLAVGLSAVALVTSFTSGGGTGAVDSVNSQTGVVVLDTDDIGEGTTNLYFTVPRARSAFTAGAGISIVGGVISAVGGSSQWTTSGSDIYYNTGNVGIGNATPAYKLDVTGDINFTGNLRKGGSIFNTDNVPEGATNKYFSNTLARGAISASGSLSYNPGTGVISYTQAVNSVNSQTGNVVLDTDDVSEGTTNKYFSNTLARGAISVSGNAISYNSGTGEISVNILNSTLPILSLKRTSTYSSSSSLTDVIPFAGGDVLADTISGWSSVTNAYTINRTGKYEVSFSFISGDYSTSFDVYLMKNGSQTSSRVSVNIEGGSIHGTFSVHDVISLTLGDAIGLKIYADRSIVPNNVSISNIAFNVQYCQDTIIQPVTGVGLSPVVTVNGYDGVVALNTSDIPEGSQVYFTNARARTALSQGSYINYNSGTGSIAVDFTRGSNALHVDKSGNDSTGDGSILKPFLTIQAAHDYAVANFPAADYITIYIGTGSYNEDVTITRVKTMFIGTSDTATKSTSISSINVSVTAAVSGVYNDIISLQNLLIDKSSGTSVVTLGGNQQYSVNLSQVYIFTSGASTSCLRVTNVSAGGMRFEAHDCIFQNTSSSAASVIFNNTFNGRFDLCTFYAGSNACLNITTSNVTTYNTSFQTNTGNSVVNAFSSFGTPFHPITAPTGSIAFTCGTCTFTSTTPNGSGLIISSGATATVGYSAFAIPPGTGSSVGGIATCYFINGNNLVFPGTNSTVSASVTRLNMSTL